MAALDGDVRVVARCEEDDCGRGVGVVGGEGDAELECLAGVVLSGRMGRMQRL